MDNKAYTPTPEEEAIYRRVEKHYIAKDVLSEAESSGCRVTPEDAEAIADMVIANDDGAIPYWTTIGTCLDIYLRDATEREMQKEGLRKYEVCCSEKLTRTIHVLAHSEDEAKKTAEAYLLEDPLGPIDYADSDTLVTPLPDDAPFPYDDHLVAWGAGNSSSKEMEKPMRNPDPIEPVGYRLMEDIIKLCNRDNDTSWIRPMRLWCPNKDGSFTALDNTFGDCAVRTFSSKEEAISWLSRHENTEH